jgi:hypothetical protein
MNLRTAGGLSTIAGVNKERQPNRKMHLFVFLLLHRFITFNFFSKEE